MRTVFIKIINVFIFFLSVIVFAIPIIMVKVSIEYSLLISSILMGVIGNFINLEERVRQRSPFFEILMKLLDDNEKKVITIVKNEGPMSLKELSSSLKMTKSEVFRIAENLVIKELLKTENVFEKERTITKYKID